MIQKGNLRIDFETVDVTTAIQWLESNTRNRPVKDQIVRQYARDMKEGRWVRESTTTIKFDINGVLLDGQHRLWAVVESQSTTTFLVARGVDLAERFVQDTGSKRSVRDILVIDGVSAGNLEVAVANRVMESFSTSFKPTATEQIEYYREHEEAIKWATDKLNCTTRGIRQAGVLAPVVRAYYTKDRDKLEHFLEVMRTGMMEGPSDSAAILLRNFVLEMGKNKIRASRRIIYGKTERAIMAVLAGEKLTRLTEVAEEQFLLPSEVKKAPKRLLKPKLVKPKRQAVASA